MITKMHIENFKCFKDFDIELGPFNVLIGPNDSGKTAFLESVRIASQVCRFQGVGVPGGGAPELGIPLGPEIRWEQRQDSIVKIEVADEVGDGRWFVATSNRGASDFNGGLAVETGVSALPINEFGPRFARSVGRADYYRLDPAAIRSPSPVDENRLSQTGDGFATFLDDLSRKHRGEVFSPLEKTFCSRFPYYAEIVIDKTKVTRIPGHVPPGKVDVFLKDAFTLKLRTAKGEVLPVRSVSDGVMLSMAYLALAASPNPPGMLLIEEPENGIHPASLKDVVATLRDLAEKKKVQVVLTTHSPYLLDLVEPEDVRVFSKDKDGAVHAARLSDYPDVEKMRKHFNAGEIWTALDEAEIVAKAGKKNG
jgi:predicted ATPase